MPKKKVKRKLKIKNILICLLGLLLITLLITYIATLKIKNIYVIGNDILSDKTILEDTKLINYPSFLMTKTKDIKRNLLKNPYINDVKITKDYRFKLYIEIKENKVLAINNENNNLILENNKIVENIYEITDAPVLINDISIVEKEFSKYFALIDKTILTKISQIEYQPNNVDDLRFLLYMNDGNLVYVTLTKIEKINKYNNIKDQLEDKKGIIYLDSGDYFEIKQ